MRCMRMNIAWMFAGGMRWKARLCSSIVIQSSAASLPALQLADFVGAGLVPGEHHVEQVAVDREVLDLVGGDARGAAARQDRRERIARIGRAAADAADDAAVWQQLDQCR